MTSEEEEDCVEEFWWRKSKPLFDHFNNIAPTLYKPGRNISLDEMRVLFKGRSANKERIKAKPIKEGYTILAICNIETGYTLQMQPKGLIPSENKANKCKHGMVFSHLNHSEKVYFRMIHRALGGSQTFRVVYMDNFFSSVNLFSALRKCNIGAAGTTCTNRSKWPYVLLINKNNQLPYMYKTAVVVDDVLCCVWNDNNVV